MNFRNAFLSVAVVALVPCVSHAEPWALYDSKTGEVTFGGLTGRYSLALESASCGLIVANCESHSGACGLFWIDAGRGGFRRVTYLWMKPRLNGVFQAGKIVQAGLPVGDLSFEYDAPMDRQPNQKGRVFYLGPPNPAVLVFGVEGAILFSALAVG